jgi:hypothetical protein
MRLKQAFASKGESMVIFTILEIGLGLAFIYLLLSSLASWFNEAIANALQLRANGLEGAIRNLLKDPPSFLHDPQQFLADHPEYQGYNNFADQFYGHPLVKALTAHTPRASKPANVTAETFALVAFDVLFPAEDFADKDASQLKAMILSKHLDPDIETTLITFIEGGARDIVALRKGLESWFNEAMDQVSGWYRRGVGRRTLVIGLVIAVALNVDTLVIANTLWQEPDLRTGLANYAQQNLANFAPDQTGNSDAMVAKLGQVRDALSAFEFPIGWNTFGPGTAMAKAKEGPVSGLIGWLLQRLLGWALTAVAVAQGAPFWFDIVRKLIAPAKPPVPAAQG